MTLSAPAAGDTVLDWSTSAGTATAGADFTAVTTETLRISAGDTTGNLRVATIGDAIAEADETFGVTLSRTTLPPGVILGADHAIGTILDDDWEPLDIPDANLRRAIEDALGLAAGTPITQLRLERLTRLVAKEAGISDLKGLEFAVHLSYLDLYSNNVEDVSPLAGLTNLTSLYLGFNSISDIAPLVELTNLTRLDIGENCLDRASLDVHVPALQRRGVEVRFDSTCTSGANSTASVVPGLINDRRSTAGSGPKNGQLLSDVPLSWMAAEAREQGLAREDHLLGDTGSLHRAKHYSIPPLQRFDLDEVLRLIRDERCFVLHAPRQTGKTSVLLALRDLLKAEGEYRCVYTNVEAGQTARSDVGAGIQAVLAEISERALVALGDGFLDETWERTLSRAGPHSALRQALGRWSLNDPKRLMLLIDEIDALVGDTLISVLRQLRAGYDLRPAAFPQSVIFAASATCGIPHSLGVGR